MRSNSNGLISRLSGLFGILFLIAFSGCSGGTEVGNPSLPPPNDGASMITFASEQELETYLRNQYASQIFSNDAYGQSKALQAEAMALSADSQLNDFSGTNVQEAGVDESDTVKTDGNFLYIAATKKIVIVKAIPPDEMSVVNTIAVDGWVDEIYLFNHFLAVLFLPSGNSGNPWYATMPVGGTAIGMPYWNPVNIQTGLLLVDVSNPSDPQIIKTIKTDGRMVSSRLTDGKLHIIQQFLPDLPPLQLTYDGTEQNRLHVIQANRQALDSLTLDDFLPSYTLTDSQGSQIESGRLVSSWNFYRPTEPGGGSIVTVTTFNLNEPDQIRQSVGIVADAHIIYASTQSLYVCATLWGETVSSGNNYTARTQTAVHKLDISGVTVTSAGSGHIPGKILNQFSLGEYEGILRVATTTGTESWWGGNGEQSTNVYCLQTIDNQLKIIGSLEGLAPGEFLYSARFIGPRGFLVTFVKVDPLFTIDLSDPSDPKLAGELKVPGYSDYIHPLGEKYLLTIGKDTMEQFGTAWYQGIQLSIFDVSDFSDPKLLHKELIGDRGTDSEALYHHKAFTFWDENGLLAIPIDLYEHSQEPEYASKYGSYTFSGLYVYKATASMGFEYLGRIATSNSYDWTRGVFINNSIYAVKPEAVASANIDDIESSIHILSLGE